MASFQPNPAAPDLPQGAAASLPLFYRQVVPLDSNRHAHLRLDRSTGFRFATATNALPLGIAEFEPAAQHYPILFSGGAEPMPVALVGFRDNENLFVEANGAWRPAAYLPAYVRAFPFVFIEDAPSDTLYLGVEASAECLVSTGGVALFDNGRPTADLNDALTFCNAYRENLKATREFSAAIQAAGLLEERNATLTFANGGSAKLDGFKVVDPARLDTLDDATYLDWRKRGWIAALYAHLYSAGRWGRLIDIAAERFPKAA